MLVLCTPRVFWLEPMFPCAMQLLSCGGRAGIDSDFRGGRWGGSVPTATRRAHVAYVRRLGSEPRRSTTWCVEPATRANVGLSTGYEIAHDDSTRFLHSQADGWESDSVSQLDPKCLRCYTRLGQYGKHGGSGRWPNEDGADCSLG